MTDIALPNDKELAVIIFGDLTRLPDELHNLESFLATLRTTLGQQRADLEAARLDAVINAVVDGKNAEARKLQQEQAVAASKEVKLAEQTVSETESAIANAEVDAKRLARQFQATLALAELQSARLNAMSTYRKSRDVPQERLL
jgi:hypothetical protein